MTHSTNYHSTLIAIAPDCVAITGIVPPKPESIAGHHHALLTASPYTMTSDDLLFAVHAARSDIPPTDAARAEFFAKPNACLRASPLPKQYGWGIHHDAEGRMAIYAMGSLDYARLIDDAGVKVTPAVRSKRA